MTVIESLISPRSTIREHLGEREGATLDELRSVRRARGRG